ncbi:MAG: cell division protein FtsZ [SAR116 cluster bacterium]|nr:cell division protein FtsZ [SAR116 cluster bacterium]
MLNIAIPNNMQELTPKITVIGVGGAGGNAVNNMIESNLEGVDFVVANTDGQALANSIANRKIQLGLNVTKGLGAGSIPDIGRSAAEESIDDILAELNDSNMVFITAGLGGGTGTGAAPIIAKAAKEKGILTVCVVTKPFDFEGSHRKRIAEEGVLEIQKYADTLIIIPNQNLFRLANEKTGFAEAFGIADNVLHKGVCGVTDLMVKPGMINLDFADIRTVMSEMGKAMMGTGEASGENRAIEAADSAINNPLLDETSMKGAKAILINITGGNDMTLFEVDEAANRIRKEIDPNANIIFGSALDKNIEGSIRVSLVATGISKIEKSNSTDNEVHSLFKDNEKSKDFIKVKENQIYEVETNSISKNDVGLNNNETFIDKKENHERNLKEEINNAKEENAFKSINEIEIKEITSDSDNLELKFSDKLETATQTETFIPNKSSEVNEIDNTADFGIKLESYTKDKNIPKDEVPSIINRISGFWSKKNDTQNRNYINEPILKSDTIEETVLKIDTIEDSSSKQYQSTDNNNNSEGNQNFEDLKIDVEDPEDKVLEIPAFLRRQVN